MGSSVSNFFESAVEAVVAPFTAPTQAAINVAEGVVDIAQGDVSEGLGEIVNAPSEMYMDMSDPYVEMMDEVGLGDVARTAQEYGPLVVGLYAGASGNFWMSGAETAAATGASAAQTGPGGSFNPAAMDVGGVGEAARVGVTGAAPGTSLAEGTAGVSASPERFLLADSGQSVTDVGPGLFEGGAPSGAPGVGDAGAFDQFGARAVPSEPFSDIIGTSAPAASRGIIGGAMDWATKSPSNTLLALGGLQAATGVVGGVGQYMAQRDLQEERLNAERELQQQKVDDAKELEEWKRRFTQSGSYFDANIPFRRKPGAILRRPDGSPVYASPGIVAGAMR